jgi:tRNA (mo5U34)-methyltransferase
MPAAELGGIAWYHTIELGDGRVTPGFYDLRSLPARIPVPASLAGRRCLDIGSSDGFWAFEMCRRGATEVLSIDLEDSAGQEWQGRPMSVEERASQARLTSGRWEADEGRTRRAFEYARAALGVEVQRLDLSVYDVSREALGEFDFVFMGSLLLHLRDPVAALAAVREVVRGELLALEPIVLSLSALLPRTPAALLWQLDEPRWWTPNLAGLRRLVAAAGFEILQSRGPLFQRFGRGFPRRLPLRRPTLRELLFWTLVRPFGGPSACVLARPAAHAPDGDRSA